MSTTSTISITDFMQHYFADCEKYVLHLAQKTELSDRTIPAIGYEYQLSMHNDSRELQLYKRVLLTKLKLNGDSLFYMEGYQMLSQTTGTVLNPRPIGRINEAVDYKLYDVDHDITVGSNLFMVKHQGVWCLIGATSATKSDLIFELKGEELAIYWDLDDTCLDGNAVYDRDYICFLQGMERSEVLELFANAITKRQVPHLSSRRTGWCSWYCYYADITENIVRDNLDFMVKNYPKVEMLEYVQIDDGFQHAMGDWLIESSKFESGLKALCAEIRAKGRKPAIWLAPFIAEGNSRVFKEHPEWFVKDSKGQPIEAGIVTYGGWRCTPWYLLDMTQNAVRTRLKHICSVLRHEYGIDYFKLDACYWGAIKGLKYAHDVTAITHYRLGLSAIRQGCGADAYLLGCNAPFWPSLGLLDAQRLTDDVDRNPQRIKQISEEFRYRAWMSGKLWMADVDCLVTAPLKEQYIDARYFRILLALALCAAGPVILGDDLRCVNRNLAISDALGSGDALTLMDALNGEVETPAILRGDKADIALLTLRRGGTWRLKFTDDDVIAHKL